MKRQALVGTLAIALILAAGMVRADESADMVRKTGRAFSDVAKKAVKAVVFIQVEKTVTATGPGGMGPMNDPFGFFGDDFFQRFFEGRDGRGQPAPQRRYRQQGQGSGFIVTKDGYILTNNHVVGDADKITVKLNDGRTLTAKRIGADPKSEVAVIKVDADKLPVLELGDSDAMEIGEWVIAIGNPFGLSETLTVGVVSATGRNNIGIAEYEDFIQTDAAINPGNSGGPLLNIDGKVIGINTAILSGNGGYMGIGFAVPINMAKAIQKQLVEKGSVTRGFMGIQLNRGDLDEEMAKSFGLEQGGGVLVADVIKDSPAEKAGLESGDIILELNGKAVRSNTTFRNEVAMIPPGTEVNLIVFRDNQRVPVKLTVGTLPGDEPVAEAAPETAGDPLGVKVRDLTSELAARFGYDFDEGVIITEVDPEGVGARAELQPGMLILGVNRRPVRNTRDFAKAINEAAKSGRALLRVKLQKGSWFVIVRFDR